MKNIFSRKANITNDNSNNEKENFSLMNQDNNNNNEWLDNDYEEGQLSVDVYQTPDKYVVLSTIAGVKPEDIDISINNDMLTIHGKREMKKYIKDEDYLFNECYWGSFSRSIILPTEVEGDKVNAVIENGVLTITLPKSKISKQLSIKVKEK